MRASLAVRPVADGDPWVGTVVATAQGTLAAPAIEISSQTLSRRSSAPVVAHWMRGPKATLEELARRAGPAPAGLAVANEPERDDRWSLVVLRAHEGMVLDVTTLVTPAWAPEPTDQPSPSQHSPRP